MCADWGELWFGQHWAPTHPLAWAGPLAYPSGMIPERDKQSPHPVLGIVRDRLFGTFLPFALGLIAYAVTTLQVKGVAVKATFRGRTNVSGELVRLARGRSQFRGDACGWGGGSRGGGVRGVVGGWCCRSAPGGPYM